MSIVIVRWHMLTRMCMTRTTSMSTTSPGTATNHMRIRMYTRHCGTVIGTIRTCTIATVTDGVQPQCRAARTMKITPRTANSAAAARCMALSGRRWAKALPRKITGTLAISIPQVVPPITAIKFG